MTTTQKIIEDYKKGNLTATDALEAIQSLEKSKLSFVTLDSGRQQRTGMPEVIFGAGKTTEQILLISKKYIEQQTNLLITRISEESAKAVLKLLPEANYDPLSKTLFQIYLKPKPTHGKIAIVSAGTSDLPIAKEAMITAKFLGNQTTEIYDVGVAGIHRLFSRIDEIREARVIIVIAGMEGALASVIGGLVDKPVIAVPTSVGYGANFGGLSALLGMLNSCAAGVSVVNIDNGYGAACQASKINKIGE